MWPRVIEIVLACWLAMSPFVFRYSDDDTLLWTMSFTASGAVLTFALLSLWTPTKRAHVASLAVAAVLCSVGYFGVETRPGPPAYQNLIVTGLLVAMFAVIPRYAALPPAAWRRYWGEQSLDDARR